MRRAFLTIFAVAMVAITASSQVNTAEREPVAPAFLRPGDTIAVLSLSSIPKTTVIERGSAALREWGFVVKEGRHARDQWRSFAGTPEARRDDLLAALRDPSVKAIISTRGGYGSANVLALIPVDTLRKYPKWIIGYSDITGYLSAMTRAGHQSIHANMLGALADSGPYSEIALYLRDLLLGERPSYIVPGNKYNQEGTATGIVVGGNMSVYGDLAGSPYDFMDPAFTTGKDIIIFIEDVGEPFAKVDRMLQLLRLRGILSSVKGVIVGRFTDYQPARGYSDMNEMLSSYLSQYDIPVCYDFPVGHDEQWNYPMIVGGKATLNVTRDKTTLKFLK